MSENTPNLLIDFNVFSPLDDFVIQKVIDLDLDAFYKYLWYLKKNEYPLNFKNAASAFNYTEEQMAINIDLLKSLSLFQGYREDGNDIGYEDGCTF